MRQVREVLRLKFVGGVPTREIARRIGIAPSTVRTTIRRFQAAGLNWPLSEEMTDAALEAKLFPETGSKQGHRRESEPEWASIHRELKRKHVTLSILWDEYIALGGLLPESAHIGGGAAPDIYKVGSVGEQAAVSDKLRLRIDRRYVVSGRRQYERRTMRDRECIRHDDKAAPGLTPKGRDVRFDLCVAVNERHDWQDA